MTQSAIQSPDELRGRKIDLVLQQLRELPTLPALAVRLLNLTGKSDSRIQEIVELISADPALTARVLSLAGSAAAAVRSPVTNVRQAVVLLGLETIRNLALSVKVFEAFGTPTATGEGEFNRADFWKHSVAVAAAAELLAPRCKPAILAPEAFVCGLLHDMGKVALDSVMPKSYARAVEVATLTRGDIADAERRILGVDHAVAGKRVAETWGLPAIIAQTIWLHATAPMSVPRGIAHTGMIQLVGLADLLVRRLHIGFSGNFLFTFEPQQYLAPLGLTDADIASVSDKLPEAMEARARVLGVYDVQSRQVYLQSIGNANAELGRANQALAAQNRKLAQRSECFELLTQFSQRVPPAASPAQVLSEIAQTAHVFFQADRLVLFSQDPEQPVGEVLTYETAGGSELGFLMPMPASGGDHRVGRGDFIRPASPQLDWLLERVGTFGAGRKWAFMPLVSAGQPVGGVLWPQGDKLISSATHGDLALVGQAWALTLRTAQVTQQHNVLTEALAASNRDLATLQQQLIYARSLASLGEMAAGAAHEMNNPLAVICGRAQLLASKLPEGSPQQDAQQIAQQGQRLSQIITDLMDFAKPAAPKLAPHSIDQIVRAAIDEASRRAGETPVTVKMESTGNIPPLSLDERQIRGAVAEVLLNAIQASAADAVKSPQVQVQVYFDTLDERAIIQVSDRGAGMSEATLRQAFAPFFSAKSAGRQRGIGLAKALRWVELHGGTIRLDSQAGVGTTAVIILPVTPPAPQTPTAAEPLNGAGA